MGKRYPGYNVLAKRDGPSWDDRTRAVVDARLRVAGREYLFFNDREWRIVRAVADRILPQPSGQARIPVAALLDRHLHEDRHDGFRRAELPPQAEAWQIGLEALDQECLRRHRAHFEVASAPQQDALLRKMQAGILNHPAWRGMPSDIFFGARLTVDLIGAYYSHPLAWNEIGFGGPASPRGYVRTDFDEHDPWEASEAKPGGEAVARRRNSRVG